MKIKICTKVLFAMLLSAAFHCGAGAAVVEGINLPETIDLGQRKLYLNGAGVRTKLVVNVYVAGLYLEQKTQTAAAALTQPGVKRVALTMLREVDSEELGKLFIRGIQDNTNRSEFGRLLPAVLKMSSVFSKYKKLKRGDTLMIDWVPSFGMVLRVKDQTEEVGLPEPEFMAAMMGIWLGPNPADFRLKDALLGKAVTSGDKPIREGR
jgi:hypothetical protein